jgi:hypothetical protein
MGVNRAEEEATGVPPAAGVTGPEVYQKQDTLAPQFLPRDEATPTGQLPSHADDRANLRLTPRQESTAPAASQRTIPLPGF